MNNVQAQTNRALGSPKLSRRDFSLAVVSLSLGLAGCKVGPNFTRPSPPPLSQQFHQASLQNPAEESIPLDPQTTRWWTYFDDPILQQLVADAVQQNLTIREAYFRIIESRAQLGLSRSQFFPQFNGITDTTYRRNSQNVNQVTSQNNQSAFMNYSNGMDSSWEIDLWGRLARGVEAAESDLLAQHESLNDIRVTLLADVATTYIQIRVLQQRLLIAQQNLNLQKQTLYIV